MAAIPTHRQYPVEPCSVVQRTGVRVCAHTHEHALCWEARNVVFVGEVIGDCPFVFQGSYLQPSFLSFSFLLPMYLWGLNRNADDFASTLCLCNKD